MKYKKRNKRNYHKLRRLWEENIGPIPIGFQIHHKIPVHAGGPDDLRNLVCLSIEDHAKAHYDRYQSLGDFRDLCSYYMIRGYNKEALKIAARIGGLVGGKKTVELGLGIHNKEKRKLWTGKFSLGGKRGAAVQMENKIGIHGLTHEQCVAYGKMSIDINGTPFRDANFQREMGKRGGPKNLGSHFYNDGIKNFKYMVDEKNLDSFETFLEKNKQYKKGRIRTWI